MTSTPKVILGNNASPGVKDKRRKNSFHHLGRQEPARKVYQSETRDNFSCESESHKVLPRLNTEKGSPSISYQQPSELEWERDLSQFQAFRSNLLSSILVYRWFPNRTLFHHNATCVVLKVLFDISGLKSRQAEQLHIRIQPLQAWLELFSNFPRNSIFLDLLPGVTLLVATE